MKLPAPVALVSVALIAIALAARAQSVPPTTAPKAAAVEIDNFTFKPATLEISVGSRVTWTNKDDVPHTATSSDDKPVFDSKTLDTDDHFSFTFTTAGTYKYYCKVHPHMTGTVIVK